MQSKAKIQPVPVAKKVEPVNINSVPSFTEGSYSAVSSVKKVEVKPLQVQQETEINPYVKKEIKTVKPVENVMSTLENASTYQKVEKVEVKPLANLESVAIQSKVVQPKTVQTVMPSFSTSQFEQVKTPTVKKVEVKPIDSQKTVDATKVVAPDISIVYGPKYGDNYNPYSSVSQLSNTQVDDVVDDISDEIIDIIASEPKLESIKEVSPIFTADLNEEVESIEDLEVFSNENNGVVTLDNENVIDESQQITDVNLKEEAVIEKVDQPIDELESLPNNTSEPIEDNSIKFETVIEPAEEEIIEEDKPQENETQQFEPLVEENTIKFSTIQPEKEENQDVIVDEDDTTNDVESVSKYVQSIVDGTVGGQIDDSDSIFAYIDEALNSVQDYSKKDENKSKTVEKEEQPLDVNDISNIVNSWNLDNYDFKAEEEPLKQEQVQQESEKQDDEDIVVENSLELEKVKTSYEPKNNVEAPVYYDNPINVDQLTQKLEKERVLREQMLEQTKQIKLQVKEYENELDSVNDSMSKTNKILNFVLTLLIMTLFVILFIIGFWFAQERGLL